MAMSTTKPGERRPPPDIFQRVDKIIKEMNTVNANNIYGPKSTHVKIVSSDNVEFLMDKKWSVVSRTINEMMKGFKYLEEDEVCEIHFRTISSDMFAQLMRYFCMFYTCRSQDYQMPPFTIPNKFMAEVNPACDLLDC